MIPATTPGDLLSVAEALAERGANGFLLSGGADAEGRVRVSDFADALGEIKSTTDLKVNVHIGLLPSEEIDRLVRSGVDSFSVDVYGSDDTIHEVLGLNARVDDYLAIVKRLKSSGAHVVAPHICVGIHGGELKGEFRAVERLSTLNPDVLVLISLIPTKGTAYERVVPPGREMLRSVIEKARATLPETKLVLGCMRSKIDRSSEIDFVRAGLDGIVLPAVRSVDGLREEGYIVKKRSVCCSLI